MHSKQTVKDTTVFPQDESEHVGATEIANDAAQRDGVSIRLLEILGLGLTHACMYYVCMYVGLTHACMHVCMYVCMYVCLYVYPETGPSPLSMYRHMCAYVFICACRYAPKTAYIHT